MKGKSSSGPVCDVGSFGGASLPGAVRPERPWSSPPISADSLGVGFDVTVAVRSSSSAACFGWGGVSLSRGTRGVTFCFDRFTGGFSMSTSFSALAVNWNLGTGGADVADVLDEDGFNSNPCRNNSNDCYE